MLELRVTSIFILLSLLVTGCQKSLSRNNLVGIWQSQCHQSKDNSNHIFDTVYKSDGTFQTTVTSKFLFFSDTSIFSGTYHTDQNKIIENITYSSKQEVNQVLPQIQSSTFDWIDADSLTISTGTITCTSRRLSSQHK